MNTTDSELKCARHPKTSTGLRCGACETPICPSCAVYTPVGVKCPDCARNRTALFSPSALQLALAGLVALFAGVAGGWIVGFLELRIWAILLAMPYGTAAGDMAMRVSGRKRGKVLETTAGVMFALGALGGRMVMGLLVLHLSPSLSKGYLDVLMEALKPLPFAPIAMAIACAAAVSRIRYI